MDVMIILINLVTSQPCGLFSSSVRIAEAGSCRGQQGLWTVELVPETEEADESVAGTVAANE